MNKQKIKKFRKNDWSSDEEGYEEDARSRKNKHADRRLDRAIRTKDVSAFNEEEDPEAWKWWPKY